MRLFIFADPHWSSYSSIVRSRGDKYSTRLENLIDTMNWVEEEALKQNCNAIVCLGDFFDKSELNSEEITALQEIKWSDLPHYMLIGNHEMGRGNLEHTSSHLFKLMPNVNVLNFPFVYDTYKGTKILFLPYILETHRKPLKEYVTNPTINEDLIILSHNDIAGIQMGKFVSTSGFSIKEIEENCKLFINGHLHNEAEIGRNIINIGNITGQNFSEDAFKYSHNAIVLDTEEHTVDKINNPYSLNFYKLDLTYMRPIIDDKDICKSIDSLRYPAVATIKVNSDCEFMVRDLLSDAKNIIECKLLVERSHTNINDTVTSNTSSVDHISKFIEYVNNNISNDAITNDELERISK